jgi:hypothetical protein
MSEVFLVAERFFAASRWALHVRKRLCVSLKSATGWSAWWLEHQRERTPSASRTSLEAKHCKHTPRRSADFWRLFAGLEVASTTAQASLGQPAEAAH